MRILAPKFIQYRGAVYRLASGIKLYRTSDRPPTGRGLFWTTSSDYAALMHPNSPLHEANLSAAAKVQHFPGSPTKRLIRALESSGLDVAVFDIWDFDAQEYVVLNPDVLENVRVIEKG